jgi:hypothetical protein
LSKAALGTVVGFAFDSREQQRHANFGATAQEILDSGELPPELPLILIQWDPRYYTGPSALQSHPNVVPVAAKEFRVKYNGHLYTREAFPLLPGTAMTIHNSQGCSTRHHVILPPGSAGPGQLAYVQWSRTETLEGVYLLKKVNTDDFTRAAGDMKAVTAEMERLRSLPKWQPEYQ